LSNIEWRKTNETSLEVYPLERSGYRAGKFHYSLEKDHFRGLLDSYQYKEGIVYWAQTIGHVVAMLQRPGQKKVTGSRYPLHRVSFVTEDVFTELFYPVILTSEKFDQSSSGQYIDASLFHSRFVGVIQADIDSRKNFIVQAKIKNQVSIPENCVPLTPATWGQGEAFSFICAAEKGKDDILWKVLPMRP